MADREHSIRGRRVACGLALLSLPALGLAEDNTFEIARFGDSAGSVGVDFSDFLEPSVNNTGAVVFNARQSGANVAPTNNSGIYRFQLTDLFGAVVNQIVEILREDSQLDASGTGLTAGDLFLTTVYLEDPQIDVVQGVTGTFNTVAFELPVRSGLAGGNTAIVVEEDAGAPGDNYHLAGAEGEDVPNGDGAYRDLGGINLFGVGTHGEVGFFSALSDTTAGTANDTAIFRRDSQNGTVEIVREGDNVNGSNLSGVFSPHMNNDGGMVFSATLAGAPALSDTAVYRVADNSTAISQVAEEGDDVPGGDGDFAVFSQLRINNDGDVAFSALLRNTDGLPDTPLAGSSALDDSAIFLKRAGGDLMALVREGDLVPSGDARYGRFAENNNGAMPRPALNDNEQVAFRVELFDTDDENPFGIFVASPDSVEHVARTGESYESGIFASFEHPALNNAAMAAFIAELNIGTVQTEEGEIPLLQKILMVSDGNERATVVREGDILNGEIVFDITFNNDPEGQTNGFSDSGLVAYEVTYESGIHAINAWSPELFWRETIPDPALEHEWNDNANWRFGLDPGAVHDVTLSPLNDTLIRGPAADVTVKSLALGTGDGEVRLLLGAGVLGTIEGLHVGDNGLLEGGGTLSGNIENHGLVQVTPGQALDVNGNFVNRSEVVVEAAAHIRFAGQYSGDGSINGNGVSLFAGGLSPGSSPVLLEIAGDAVLEASNETILEIAGLTRGSEYDSLAVGGQLTLGGTLSIVFIDGFSALSGQDFLLFEAGSLLGSFTAVVLPDIDGLNFLLNQDGTSLRLSVQAVPLPGAAWLLLSAAGLLVRRRGARSVSARDSCRSATAANSACGPEC